MSTTKHFRTDSLHLLSGEGNTSAPKPLWEILHHLGIADKTSGRFIELLPFCSHDVTAGTENELQAVVVGDRRDVDLPITIESSNYFGNMLRRIAAGEATRSAVADLQKYLNEGPQAVWENSWVRLPLRVLTPMARELLDFDLSADKTEPEKGFRKDIGRFFFQRGEKFLRIPVSYLIKLSLADVLGSQTELPESIDRVGRRLLSHFSNDNTSPEISSFYLVHSGSPGGMGSALAREAAIRFLLTQLLTMYANSAFKLRASGQHVVIYSAPTPPVRQRELNTCISDAFYRELFMSPCLSGWDRGEEKHSYMGLCHRVLSRSQLNSIHKLKEAGIILNDLVVLPSTSNISLANNGTHISLGSRRLTDLRKDGGSGLTRADEKYVGDLVIKIVEHFLPLFVGTYTAAPYRLDFTDFHPERALSFLPHELDYTHLRMIWRRWKKKADIRVLGQPLTPFGPKWLDRIISTLFQLKGDFVMDFRLIDYFVSLLSTDQSPAMDGRIGNGDRLKRDLTDMGVFDTKLAIYLLYRLREFDSMGFCGFEGRHYSLFESLMHDMAPAADMQMLVTALAYKYIAEGSVTHAHIPDSPSIESERRQIFFGTAIGVPTFYVRGDTPNQFLKKVIGRCGKVRQSRRYPGYLRVYNDEYRRALVRMIQEDGKELIDMMKLSGALQDLVYRLDDPVNLSASGKLTRSILQDSGMSSPMELTARDFNTAAERLYRDTLRKKHLLEALSILQEDAVALDFHWATGDTRDREALGFTAGNRGVTEMLHSVQQDLLDETATVEQLKSLINLLLVCIGRDMRQAAEVFGEGTGDDAHEAPVYRAVHA